MHGNIYGTTFEAVQRVTGADKVCILDVDVQGAEAVKRTQLGAAFVFIAPPSMDELERRLRGRGTETEEKARTRRRSAAALRRSSADARGADCGSARERAHRDGQARRARLFRRRGGE